MEENTTFFRKANIPGLYLIRNIANYIQMQHSIGKKALFKQDDLFGNKYDSKNLQDPTSNESFGAIGG